jgi:hypothetical protein
MLYSSIYVLLSSSFFFSFFFFSKCKNYTRLSSTWEASSWWFSIFMKDYISLFEPLRYGSYPLNVFSI